MKIAATSAVSFKSAYHIKGSDSELDEICWYMGKKKKESNGEFDFVDIRVDKERQNASQSLLGHFDKSVLENPEKAKAFSDKLIGALAFDERTGFQADGQNLDLFLTNQEKKLAESKAVNMVEDTVANRFSPLISFGDKAKDLLNNLSKMRDGFSQNKPITNIGLDSVKKHLDSLNLANTPLLKAKEVLDGIKKGTFDVATGLMKSA